MVWEMLRGRRKIRETLPLMQREMLRRQEQRREILAWLETRRQEQHQTELPPRTCLRACVYACVCVCERERRGGSG